MNPYPAYKASGVPWLGDVPEHWEKFRVKNLIELITESSNDPHKIGLENIESGTGRFLQTDNKFEGNGIRFQVGDIVYGKLRPYLQKVWIAEFPGNAVGDFYVFRPKSAVNIQFLRFMFLSQSYTDVINSSTYGAKMPRVSSAFILSPACYIPPSEEQSAIVAYLDEKCAQIDESVARRLEIIEKLRELRQAIIAQTVTKGLNPRVPMKDSGIPWIGKVPEHWEISRLRKCMVEIKERNSPVRTTKILSLTNKAGVIPYEERGNQGNKAKENYEEYKLAYPKTLVMNSMNVLIGSVGICEYFGCVSPVYYVYKPTGSASLLYLNYIFQNVRFLKELRIYAKGIMETRMRLSSSDILKRNIPYPPPAEQAAIAAYLDEKCTRIDELILRHERTAEKLKELKAAMIAEVVTGKVDVRKKTKQQMS